MTSRRGKPNRRSRDCMHDVGDGGGRSVMQLNGYGAVVSRGCVTTFSVTFGISVAMGTLRESVRNFGLKETSP